ncbi:MULTISPECIES: xanthine dehydrogenase accessory protein XdhC [Halomonadaceae]|uniref:xanthine dehydrogenase accessory protein XdhC n=1 Tax=Halomonadaceae TaxID=28256 RepID=UPI0020C62F47|nr:MULTISPECIES: xanthine dehydrogenase accessory protein XdhC [Halomonas]MDI4638977.1 xanthine dehydrogenase accessory protein XdhC [Halomonas sp. BMC7]
MSRPEADAGRFQMASHWHAALHRLQEDAQPHVLATLVGAAGSTPREPGTKMVITPEASFDTLGGGTFEFQVIAAARQALTRGDTAPSLEAFPLGGRSGQCCGGYVHVLIEPFAGAERRIALFGAGHVGQALASLIAPLPWRLDWFDSRPDAFPPWAACEPGPARLRLHSSGAEPAAISAAAHSLSPGSDILVMTHDHGQDLALIEALLERHDLASIGLIGSASKWASFKRRLTEAGHDADAIARVRCPIGIAGADGKRPYEIALAVVAELMTLASARPDAPDRRGIAPDTLRQAFGPDR